MDENAYRGIELQGSHYLAGLLPFLYICESLVAAVYACVVITAVFSISAVTVLFCRGLIPYALKSIFFIIISATWVSVAALLLEAFLVPVKELFGVYLFIIPMNTTLLCILDDCLHDKFTKLLRPALLCILACLSFAVIREFLASGGVYLSNAVLTGAVDPASCSGICIAGDGISIFDYTAGSLILAGLLLATWNFFSPEPVAEQ